MPPVPSIKLFLNPVQEAAPATDRESLRGHSLSINVDAELARFEHPGAIAVGEHDAALLGVNVACIDLFGDLLGIHATYRYPLHRDARQGLLDVKRPRSEDEKEDTCQQDDKRGE